MLNTNIVDGTGNKYKTCVTPIGQLVTAPFAYDDVIYKELAVNDTAYNFFLPQAGKQFVITGFYAKADKQVSSTTEADFIIYEATGLAVTTVSKILFETAMLQYDQLSLIGLNLLVNTGVWINGKTTDDDVHVTMMGYYIPELT